MDVDAVFFVHNSTRYDSILMFAVITLNFQPNGVRRYLRFSRVRPAYKWIRHIASCFDRVIFNTIVYCVNGAFMQLAKSQSCEFMITNESWVHLVRTCFMRNFHGIYDWMNFWFEFNQNYVAIVVHSPPHHILSNIQHTRTYYKSSIMFFVQ